jgi:hypothetical protein
VKESTQSLSQDGQIESNFSHIGRIKLPAIELKPYKVNVGELLSLYSNLKPLIESNFNPYSFKNIPTISLSQVPRTTHSSMRRLQDSLHQPVTTHLAPVTKEERAVSRTLTRWRQTYRATTLHRKDSLFHSTSKNTLGNKFHYKQLPLEFRELATVKLPTLIETTSHQSASIASILHDGILYPKMMNQKARGISTHYDYDRFDQRLVFSSPFHNYKSPSKIKLSVKGCCLFLMFITPLLEIHIDLPFSKIVPIAQLNARVFSDLK